MDEEEVIFEHFSYNLVPSLGPTSEHCIIESDLLSSE